MTQKLTPFTFPSTGIQIALKPVNFLMINELIQAIDEPVPPTVKVENPDGSFRDEPNDRDPKHLVALRQHDILTNETAIEAFVDFGVVYRLRDEDHEQVKAFRNLFKRKSGKDHPATDMQIFIRFIAMSTAEDIKDFLAAVKGGSMPTDPKSNGGSEASQSSTGDATSSNIPLPAAESPTQSN